jgi:hypothetical protein
MATNFSVYDTSYRAAKSALNTLKAAHRASATEHGDALLKVALLQLRGLVTNLEGALDA